MARYTRVNPEICLEQYASDASLLHCAGQQLAQSAIGTVDARHGGYPRRFGQGFEIKSRLRKAGVDPHETQPEPHHCGAISLAGYESRHFRWSARVTFS